MADKLGSLWCSLAEPLDIINYQPEYQPWRDLENELLTVWDQNVYFSIVTPDDIMGNDTDLATAVLKEGYTWGSSPSLGSQSSGTA